LSPIVTVDSAVVSVDEGQWVINGGTVTDLDGVVVGWAASAGDLVVSEGVWSWTYFAADGPDDGDAVKILAIDDDGATGYGAFDLVVHNVPPNLGPISNVPVVAQVGWLIQSTVVFTDPAPLDRHTAVVDWGDGNVCNTSVGALCSIDQGTGIHRTFAGFHTYTEPGLYTIVLTVTDDDGSSDSSTFETMVAYDPQVGSMTGGGWIDSPPGAHVLDPSWTGRDKFSLDVKYDKGAQVPKGELRFVFGDGALSLYSNSYDWMTITEGSDAVLAGRGTINAALAPNGEPYRFMLWANDRGRGRGEDTFRIKIWWGAAELIYDNGTDQAIARGAILVHAKKK
jgi:hypothetical protein